MQPTESTWGVTPVPDRLRTLSGLDVGLLWGNLGISLLVLFTGSFLAGLGLQRALSPWSSVPCWGAPCSGSPA